MRAYCSNPFRSKSLSPVTTVTLISGLSSITIALEKEDFFCADHVSNWKEWLDGD